MLLCNTIETSIELTEDPITTKTRLCALAYSLFVACSLSAIDIDRSSAPISVAVSTNLLWGYDFDAKTSGFNNSSSLELTVPFLDQSTTKSKRSNIYADVAITNLNWNFDQVKGGAFNPTVGGAVTSKLWVGSYYLTVFGTPDFSSIDLQPGAANDLTFNGFSDYTYGTALGFKDANVPYEGELQILSGATWQTNSKNLYAYGAKFNLFPVPDMLQISGNLAVLGSGPLQLHGYISAPLSFDLVDGLTITPASVYQYVSGNFDFVADLNAIQKLSENNDNGNSTHFELDAFYGRDKKLSGTLAFQEPGLGGLLGNAGFAASYSVLDVLGGSKAWNAKAHAEYTFLFGNALNTLVPSADFTIDSTNAQTLIAGITYANLVITGMNLTVSYASGNYLAATPGIGSLTTSLTLTL
jgi:hypothetical protein